jgi:hypothetical protein
MLHEFVEDVGELNDGVAGNDSFFDGGLGENDVEPVGAPADPPAAMELVVDGAIYSWYGGNFTYVGGGGPVWGGGGGGGGDMDIFGSP